MMGKCKKQEFCTYSHDEILTGSSEVASTEAKPRTSLQINKPLVPCIFFEKGTCRNGYACRFLHLKYLKTKILLFFFFHILSKKKIKHSF